MDSESLVALKATISKRHRRILREINDIHIFASKVIQLISPLTKISADQLKKNPKKIVYRVPALAGKLAIAMKSPLEVVAMMERFKKSELYQNLLVSAVSRLEFHLADVMSEFLQYNPQKLSVGPKGGDSNMSVPVQTVLECSTIAEVRTSIIQQRLQAIFYVEPKDYIRYFNIISELGIEEQECQHFFEIKATRDLILHNSLQVNELYLKKAGPLARGGSGKKLAVNKIYFENSIAHIKALAISIWKKVDNL